MEAEIPAVRRETARFFKKGRGWWRGCAKFQGIRGGGSNPQGCARFVSVYGCRGWQRLFRIVSLRTKTLRSYQNSHISSTLRPSSHLPQYTRRVECFNLTQCPSFGLQSNDKTIDSGLFTCEGVRRNVCCLHTASYFMYINHLVCSCSQSCIQPRAFRIVPVQHSSAVIRILAPRVWIMANRNTIQPKHQSEEDESVYACNARSKGTPKRGFLQKTHHHSV